VIKYTKEWSKDLYEDMNKMFEAALKDEEFKIEPIEWYQDCCPHYGRAEPFNKFS
jgi:hypothetical protein